MLLADLDLLVDDDPVKTLLGRFRGEFFGQCNVLFAGETEGIDDPLDLVLVFLNALGDLHLLFASQQRDLAHLLEVHADGVVQDIEPRLVFFFFLFGRLGAVYLGLINDLDLEVTEFDVDLIHLLRGHGRVGQNVTDVAVSQVALLLRLADQFFDLLGDVHTGGVLNGADVRTRSITVASSQLSELTRRGPDGHGRFFRYDDVRLVLLIVGGFLGPTISLFSLRSRDGLGGLCRFGSHQ